MQNKCVVKNANKRVQNLMSKNSSSRCKNLGGFRGVIVCKKKWDKKKVR